MEAPAESLFARLKASCPEDWQAYIEHPFVTALGDGTLPEAAFRAYLGQDYLFLIHFARAYALAVYKSNDIVEMRQATDTLDALINQEMRLHIEFCTGWGLGETEMAALPEARENIAYTRFVLDKGLAGDLLDLLVALAPCVVGYAEIGTRLASQPANSLADNPYRAWVETYAGADYQSVAVAAIAQLDRVAEKRLGGDLAGGRWPSLAATFRAATQLEAEFWGMGLRLAGRERTAEESA